nr:MAG TPA: hypothetical protein [Caudoviricetes sp.]
MLWLKRLQVLPRLLVLVQVAVVLLVLRMALV